MGWPKNPIGFNHTGHGEGAEATGEKEKTVTG
jgi:hypothetical protein